MGITVPIPTTIKERGVYQALVKIARAFSQVGVISVQNRGTVNVTDDPSIPSTPNFVLLETFQIDTGILYTDYISDDKIYNFKAGVIAGVATYTPGEPAAFEVECRVEPVSLGATLTVEIEVSVFTRRISAVSGVVVEWKAQRLG